MNEVEKMYKLANVQPQYKKRIEFKERYSIGQPCKKSPCINCDKSVFEDVMPPFTAEKQLNIIKWLLKSYDIGLSQLGERIDTSLDGINCISGLGSGNTFEESLAQAINDLWQDLTDVDKTQIKEILE